MLSVSQTTQNILWASLFIYTVHMHVCVFVFVCVCVCVFVCNPWFSASSSGCMSGLDEIYVTEQNGWGEKYCW